VAGAFMMAGLTVSLIPRISTFYRCAGGAVALVAAWYAIASFAAFHWMFDRSELLRGVWVKEETGQSPARWVEINVGLEETTLPLADVFPAAEGRLLDLYNPIEMTEPAVSRAKRAQAASPGEEARPEALPINDGWADLVVVTLAAHEIRDQSRREMFFRELWRISSTEGHVVIIEHLRNVAALLAFGPGIFHFYPRSTWLKIGKLVGLKLERERSITPFVRVFVYRRIES